MRRVPWVTEKIRPYITQGISQLRREDTQKGTKAASYMIKLWEKGADTVTLSELDNDEKIKNIVENPAVYEALDTAQGDVHCCNICPVQSH